jgi:dTDP-glucose 4,6-dehydratase
MKKVIFLGGAGFIGSNFIRKALFNKSNYNFVTIDVCKGNNVLNNIYANKGHKFYIGDITDKHFLNVVFELERPDIVIHGAVHADNNTEELIKSNILGTQLVIEACKKWSVERIIYLSTEQVYQSSLESLKLTENSLVLPKNIYAISKLTSEFLIKASGLNYNITRSCSNYGPRQQKEYLIPTIINNIISNKEVILKNKGEELNEWIHVEDNCSGIMTVLEKGLPNETYNISCNYEFSQLEVFQEICNNLEKGHHLIKFVEDGSTSSLYSLHNNKLKELGWKPNYKFRNGLSHTINWYQKNPWFLKII